MSRPESPYQAAVFVTALGVYFIAGPIVSLILGSWWPMLLGLGGFLGVMCIILAVNIVREARKPKTLAEQVSEAIVAGLVKNAERVERERHQ